MAFPNPYTEQHELLRESVRKFIEREISPNVEYWEKNKICSREVFEKFGEQGFIGVTYPEVYGGSAMDIWAATVVTHELSYANCGGLAMSLYAHTYLPLPLINALGTEDQKENYLKPAILGQKIAALGLTEPGAGSDLGSITTTAVDKGDHFVVNGAKTYITNGNMADFVVLLVRTGEGYDMSVLIFDTNTPGFSTNKLDWKLGMHTSDTAQLFFDNCIVPKSALLGQKGMGFYYVMNNIQEERIVAAASAVYGAESALERAKKYAKERHAFGRAIGKHQVIRHKIAHMATKVEAARALTERAIFDFIDKGTAATKIVSMAKAFACEVANEVIDDCLQIYGGAGYMEEYGVARSWRDMRLLTVGGGTTEVMYEVIAKLEQDEVRHNVNVIKPRVSDAVGA